MKTWAAQARNDVVGGFFSASVAIPLSLGYGMFAFVALGDDYFTYGLVAGLLSSLIVGLVNIVLRDRSLIIYAPRIVSNFFIGAILHSLVGSEQSLLRGAPAEYSALILLLIISMAGFFQFLFGAIRMGSLLKHTPYPVLAGFQNAAAILLFLVQVSNVLGYPKLTPIDSLVRNLPELAPLSLLIGLVTIAVTWNGKKLAPQVPPVVSGIAAGTVVYYLLAAMGLQAHLGNVIGEGQYFEFGIFPAVEFMPALGAAPASLATAIVLSALGLAFVASLDALLCARLLQGAGSREDSNKQLMRLGAANCIAGGLGGITSGINLGPSTLNRTWGAKTPLSVLVNISLVLLTLCALLPLVGMMPRAALSGAIMVIAYQHIDSYTVALLKRLLAGSLRGQYQLMIDLAFIVLVTTVAIVSGIVAAVVIGIVLAVVLFLLRMSQSILRSSYDCSNIRSRKRRNFAEENILLQRSSGIRTLVLQGALFFGTTERLIDNLAKAIADQKNIVILDFLHITDIDTTGTKTLSEAALLFKSKGIALLLCNVNTQTHWGHMLRDSGVLNAAHGVRVFPDTDRALEWAEDALILQEGPGHLESGFLLENHPLFMGMSVADRRLACLSFRQCNFQEKDVLFRQGDRGNEMFLIVQGSASVHLKNQNGGSTRLVTFTAGTLFGELALLDHQPRSATVTAETALQCYALSNESFEQLKQQAPSIAIQIALNLGRELGKHLRSANQTIYHLSS